MRSPTDRLCTSSGALSGRHASIRAVSTASDGWPPSHTRHSAPWALRPVASQSYATSRRYSSAHTSRFDSQHTDLTAVKSGCGSRISDSSTVYIVISSSAAASRGTKQPARPPATPAARGHPCVQATLKAFPFFLLRYARMGHSADHAGTEMRCTA